jgi:hypothetical protein
MSDPTVENECYCKTAVHALRKMFSEISSPVNAVSTVSEAFILYFDNTITSTIVNETNILTEIRIFSSQLELH